MPISISQLLTGAVAAGAIALAAVRFRFLVPSGAFAAFLLGTVVFGLGGLAWSAPLITFFITGSLLSKYGRRRKKRLEETFEKGSSRDAGQVLANGGIAGMVVIIQALFPSDHLFLVYLGSLAAAAADTWGTEIGVLGRGGTLGLPSFRPVPRGTSGGISFAGTLGAAAGAFVVALSGALAGLLEGAPAGGTASGWWRGIVIATVAGIAGMLADSIAGGTIQARYRCAVCGAVTERRSHCGAAAALIQGHRAITNDAVNAICTLAGACVAYLFR